MRNTKKKKTNKTPCQITLLEIFLKAREMPTKKYFIVIYQ